MQVTQSEQSHFQVGDLVRFHYPPGERIMRTGQIVQVYAGVLNYYRVLLDGQKHLVHGSELHLFLHFEPQDAPHVSLNQYGTSDQLTRGNL
jgi:hypothetical protein